LGVSTPASAQDAPKEARIGFLAAISAQGVQSNLRGFLEVLRAQGWVEGQNLHIEYSYDSLGGPALEERASKLAKLDLRLIVADSTTTSLALKRTGFSRPVVFVAVSEPVEIGLVDSLAKPGRNFTGFTTVNRELMPKRIELIKEMVPRVRRLIYMGNPEYASHQHSVSEVTEVAGRLGLRVDVFGLRKPADFETVEMSAGQLRDAVFVVEQSQFFIQNADRMIALEQKSMTPAMYATRQFVDQGGTVCYGVSQADLVRRSGGYVDRILRLGRPGHSVETGGVPAEYLSRDVKRFVSTEGAQADHLLQHQPEPPPSPARGDPVEVRDGGGIRREEQLAGRREREGLAQDAGDARGDIGYGESQVGIDVGMDGGQVALLPHVGIARVQQDERHAAMALDMRTQMQRIRGE